MIGKCGRGVRGPKVNRMAQTSYTGPPGRSNHPTKVDLSYLQASPTQNPTGHTPRTPARRVISDRDLTFGDRARAFASFGKRSNIVN
jgi:hypothetical protein